jgi:CrcB protein
VNWLLVIAGAAIGAPLRYLTDRAVQSRLSGALPWGTFTANVAGSLILGLVTGATTSGQAPRSSNSSSAPACAARSRRTRRSRTRRCA